MCRLLVLLLLPAVAFAQAKPGTNYAFLVSCGEKYNKAQLRPLPKSFRDMDDYRKALLATGFDDDNIAFLHDRTTEPERYLPEKDKILTELTLLLKSVGPNDTLVVALNGHGLHFKGDKTSYFCPLKAKVSDKTTMIPMDGEGGLFPILKACKAKRKLLVVGACRNDPKEVTQAAEQIDLDLLDPDEVPEGIVALYSCKAGQKTYFEEDKDRSFFFDHLIRAWQGEYHPGEDKVSLEAIFEKVKTTTSAAVRKQYAEAQVPEVRREYDGEWLVSRGGVRPAAKTAAKGPKPGEEKAYEIAKNVKMTFCWVPAGESPLGSPKAEQEYVTKSFYDGKRPDWMDAESEENRAKFKTTGFWMGKYEVTQGEWEMVMGAETNKSSFKGLRLPVENVSWEDCQGFTKKCAVPGLKVTLPHEDQWEYACRGGKGNEKAFFWGDKLNGDKANHDGNYPYGTTSKGVNKAETTEVGSYEKAVEHSWGLCDMSGNVAEWCENLHTTSGATRVIRGGSWKDYARLCRSTTRYHHVSGLRVNFVGLRIALVH